MWSMAILEYGGFGMPYANLLSQDSEGTSQAADMESENHLVQRVGVETELTTTDPNDAPLIPEPNEDPLRRRIANRVRGLRAIWQRVTGTTPRPLTMDEIASLDDAKRLEMQEKVLQDEAKVAAKRLSNALDRMGFSHRRYSATGDLRNLSQVQFDVVVSTEDAHWLHVDMDHLPWGVNTSAIIEQRVLDDLGKSVGHKVNLRATDEMGIWYIVERASGMMGIPIHVQITDMWRRYPPSANGLTIPVGMTNNRKAVYEDLDEMVHALVAGETGGGKSNMQGVIISTLARRNNPDQLKMLLLDMKAGMEFQYYEGLPHLLEIPDVTKTGIIEDPDQVYPAFKWLLNYEAKRRMGIIRGSGHRSISDYNARRKHPMPRLLVVCDEWGQARLGNKGDEAEHELSKAAMLLRAVGVHIIIGTQTPTKQVLGLLVRSNLPTKMAFNCNEISASTIIVGNGAALGLPVGRCIYKRGGRTLPVQTPYLSTEMIRATVRDVIEGKTSTDAVGAPAHDVTLDEMLLYGLHHLGGGLSYRDIHKAFDHRGLTQAEVVDTLKNLDNQEVTVDGKTYVVEPGSGSRPRRLIAVDQPAGPGGAQ